MILGKLHDRCELNLQWDVVTNSLIRESVNWELHQGSCQNGKTVRVKILRKVVIPSEWMLVMSLLKRIANQVETWCDLSHPNVAKMRGWMLRKVEGNLQAGLIAGWYKGVDIKSYLSHHPEVDRHSLIMDVCWGLDYLHKEEIVHANIKPTNIIISTPRGIAVLCDFGLPSLFQDTSTYADALRELRSVRYTAPELLKDDGIWPHDKSSDIWAFGCVFIEITSGKCPYDGIKDGVELEEAIAEGNPAYTEDDLKEVEEVVAKCLQRFPGQRPQIRQVLEAIDD